MIKTNSGIKKAFIRNQIFFEADDFNKKGDSITTSTITGVYWIDKDRNMTLWPAKKWIELAESKDYWGN